MIGKHLEVTPEDADAFVRTLQQAGIRQHTQTRLGDDTVADIIETDALHTEVWRTGKRVSLVVCGRTNAS